MFPPSKNKIGAPGSRSVSCCYIMYNYLMEWDKLISYNTRGFPGNSHHKWEQRRYRRKKKLCIWVKRIEKKQRLMTSQLVDELSRIKHRWAVHEQNSIVSNVHVVSWTIGLAIIAINAVALLLLWDPWLNFSYDNSLALTDNAGLNGESEFPLKLCVSTQLAYACSYFGCPARNVQKCVY